MTEWIPAPDPTVLVVFGATGDLMTRKIVPALAHLYMRGRLPERFRVIGFSRRDWDDWTFREHVGDILDSYSGTKPEGTHRGAFLGLLRYRRGTFEDREAYRQVAADLASVNGEWGVSANRLFYLAVPPESYRLILESLAGTGLASQGDAPAGWTRVLVEKPFGRDAATARALDELLGSLFGEEQIYRIDHYLAKEMLQGIINFRFSNNLFESAWDNRAIERIDMRLRESVGVEGRGAFYDRVGALRDVGQNHLLQMLALITMERPAGPGAQAIRSRRAEILRSLRLMSPADVRRLTYRAQYAGYREVEGVEPDSATETYFLMRTALTEHRWTGVPVTLESGKRLGSPRKEIVVTFRHPEPCLCPVEGHRQNRVVFTLEPEESIAITFWAKRPGIEPGLEERRFDFLLYQREEKAQYVEEYSRLLLDTIVGDQTLFVSTEEVRAMWEFIDPVTREWGSGAVPLESYAPDSPAVTERAEAVLEANRTAGGVRREIGLVGLGKMGAALARNLMDSGWSVVGYNRTFSVAEGMAGEGLVPAPTLKDLVAGLPTPRIVWVMVPAGEATERVIFGGEGIDGLSTLLSPGDTVIDGGNSHFGDAPGRAERLAAAGIGFVDVGTSGGPGGARHGACLMIGGRREIFERLDGLWGAIAAEGGYQFFEGYGAGHFVKMVHNGIEYGMMQALAEGFNLMHVSGYRLDLTRVADVYNHGSVVESRLVGWLKDAFTIHGRDLDGVSGTVRHTGEGAWTVDAALESGAEIRVIRGALEFRLESEKSPTYAGRILTALRDRFGGHGV